MTELKKGIPFLYARHYKLSKMGGNTAVHDIGIGANFVYHCFNINTVD